MKDCNFTLQGDKIQHVVVKVQPNESILADISTMVCMDEKISINLSYHELFQRIINRELEWVHFNNLKSKEATIILSPRTLGRVVEVDLSTYSSIYINKTSFMCANSNLEFNNLPNKLSDFFSVLNTINNESWLLLHSRAEVIVKKLDNSENLIVNKECLMAMTEKTACNFIDGDDGLKKNETVVLMGPGTVWLQTNSLQEEESFMSRPDSKNVNSPLN